jgi:DNA-binding MarR family transcriptional regulator
LSALLGAVHNEFTRDFERRLAAAGFPDLSLALGANFMRFLGPEGIRLGELAGRAGVSKQAISQQAAYLADRGYVVIEPDPADHRAKRVRPLARGIEAQRVSRTLFATVERAWVRRFGADQVRRLRALLEEMAPACAEDGGMSSRA